MNFLKLNSSLFSLIAIAMVTVFLSSCEKDYIKVSPNENINAITLEQLKSSQQRWNEKFSDKITLLNYEYVGTIENEQDEQDILEKIADEATVIASGDLNQPESVKVEVLKENSAKANTTKNNLHKYVKGGIEIGNQVIVLNWDKNGEQFITYCIADKDGIVWDNILGGVVAVDSEIKKENGSSSNKKGASTWYKQWWYLKYFWGSKAGETGYKITIHHDGNNVYDTDHEDWGWMSFGKAVSESRILVNNGSYGKVQFALAIVSPGGDINFDRSGFKVSVSGIGWNQVANGTKTLRPGDY